MVNGYEFESDDEDIRTYSVSSDEFWEKDEITETEEDEEDEREQLIRLGIDPDWDFSKDWFWQEDPYEEDEEEEEGDLDDIELEFADESNESSLSIAMIKGSSEDKEGDLLLLDPDEVSLELDPDEDKVLFPGLDDDDHDFDDEDDQEFSAKLVGKGEIGNSGEDECYGGEESERFQSEHKVAERNLQHSSSSQTRMASAQEVGGRNRVVSSDKDSHDEVHYVTLRPSWVEQVILVAITVMIAVGISIFVGGLLFYPKTGKSAVGKTVASSSPQAVATSVLGDLEVGRLGSVCRYVAPPEQASCQGVIGSGLFMGASNSTTFRNLKAKDVIVSGNQAIVLVGGEVCARAGSSCSGLGNVPVPKTYAGFKKLYSVVVSGSGTKPVMAFVKTGNRWYLELG